MQLRMAVKTAVCHAACLDLGLCQSVFLPVVLPGKRLSTNFTVELMLRRIQCTFAFLVRHSCSEFRMHSTKMYLLHPRLAILPHAYQQ
jgi:hypothetical protein